MTDPIRALCAELADAYLRLLEHINNSTRLGYEPSDDPLLLRARAALAKPVAEPPAVTKQPSDEELGLIYHDCCGGCEFMDQGGFEDAARAVLARWGQPPAPPAVAEGPSDDELELVVIAIQALAPHQPDLATHDLGAIDRGREILRDCLARWGQPPAPPAERHAAPVPVPVAVSERLPGTEDCDATGNTRQHPGPCHRTGEHQ